MDHVAAPFKQICRGLTASGSIEQIFFLDLYPGQLSPLATQLVAQTCKFLFFCQMFFAGNKPLFFCNDLVVLDVGLLIL